MKKKFNGPHSAHSLGGKASSANMTPEQRIKRAQAAIAVRWNAKKAA